MKLKTIACIALIAAFATACSMGTGANKSEAVQSSSQPSVEQTVSSSSLSPSDAEPQQNADKENSVINDKQPEEKDYTDSRKILYRYIPESGLYDVGKFLEFEEEPSYNDIFNVVTDEVFNGQEIPPVISMYQNKGYIVCDLGEEWLDSFNKGQLNEFCNTLVMTLCRNGYCENVGFKIDGKTGLLGGEVWELAELKVLESGTAEQFAEIRAEIPYKGMELNGGESYFALSDSLKKDETAAKIHNVLRLAGELTNEFEHPSDMEMKNAVLNLIWATKPFNTDADGENYDVETVQRFMPIAASVSQRLNMQETCFWLKEHIELTAYQIFGNDIVIKHCDPKLHYKWFETEGVYTPPHMGGAGRIIPHIYSYSVDDKTVTVEAAYLRETMQGYYDAVLDKFTDNYDEVEDYLKNRAERHKIILQTESDGRFTVRQHYISNPGGN